MKIQPNTALALVTARGGSKSIPLKNIVRVKGKPLLAYSLRAARAARTIDRIVCSTEHPDIAAVARENGAEVMDRPEHLRGDLVNSLDVVIDAALTLEREDAGAPEIIVLIQPTSIFLTSAHIDAAVQALKDDPKAKSSQTVIKVPHQFHAHNQRAMSEDGRDIGFVYPKERAKGHSKQTKPVHYTYGNLIVTRTVPLIEERNLFPRPSIPIVIPLEYAYDLDGWDDIPMAEIMLERGMVELD